MRITRQTRSRLMTFLNLARTKRRYVLSITLLVCSATFGIVNFGPPRIHVGKQGQPLDRFDHHGVSDLSKKRGSAAIACACRDRNEALKASLPSWLNSIELDEIVLVDWSSTETLLPLAEDLFSILLAEGRVSELIRITFARIQFEDTWVLARAFNLAVQLTSSTIIIKADCDYLLKPTFLHEQLIQLCQDCFIRGNWADAVVENEKHLNGFAIFYKEHFLSVGGYDERIQTYGWDDDDLYARLADMGLRERFLQREGVIHISHADTLRLQPKSSHDPVVQIQTNRFLLGKLPKWNNAVEFRSTYSFTGFTCGLNKCMFGQADNTPRSVEELVTPQELQQAYSYGYKVALGSMLGVSDEFLTQFSLWQMKEMLRICKVHNLTSVIVVEPMHGVGNRLRAMASAMQVALLSRRLLIVHWKQDNHNRVPFQSLFASTPPWMMVIESLNSTFPLCPRIWKGFDAYTYMPEDVGFAKKDAEILSLDGTNVFFRSAYVMNHRYADWRTLGLQIARLIPSGSVQRIQNQVGTNDWNNTISVHIRSLAVENESLDVDLEKVYGGDGLMNLRKYRSRSRDTSLFEQQMLKQLEYNPQLNFYVSMDDPIALRSTILKWEQIMTILYLDHNCTDRHENCVQLALADLLNLSKGRSLIGSEWSSFSEVAFLLGKARGTMKELMLVGCDSCKGDTRASY